MNEVKRQATETMDELHQTIPYCSYCAVMDGLQEIETLRDQRYSKGIAYLLYGGAEDYVPETKRLYGLRKRCFECESRSCQFNHDGECRFVLVHEREPQITEADGCIDYDYSEENT